MRKSDAPSFWRREPHPRDGEFMLWKRKGTWRWKAYSAKGVYGRRGVTGRWQLRARYLGGWKNATLPNVPWMRNAVADITLATLRARAPQMMVNLMKANPLLQRLLEKDHPKALHFSNDVS